MASLFNPNSKQVIKTGYTQDSRNQEEPELNPAFIKIIEINTEYSGTEYQRIEYQTGSGLSISKTLMSLKSN
jgi:hypothetical protein